jgi:DNA-binding SARP family transcriptional activator/tetratricopeptide (TPR) repeat protein
MDRLRVALLGAPEVQLNDAFVTFPTRKTLALLSYLVVEGGAQPRERLVALFWPNSSSELGRAALRKTLAYLRQALADQAADTMTQPYILAERDTLRLNPAAASTVDVWLVQAAAQMLRQPSLSANSPTGWPSAYLHSLLEPLRRASTLVRGDLLVGFSLSDLPEFDEWASMQREVLRRQALQIFDRLSQIEFEAGELANAVLTTTRWVAYDLLDETACRRLMQIHFASGDRSAALQAYAACRAALERDLAIEPAEETTSLAQRIKASKTLQRLDSPAYRRDPQTHAMDLHAVPPMVGRAFEHGQLVAAYRRLHAGHTQLFTLEGEPGIGKTRVALEFLSWVGADGGIVLQGRALEGGQLSYQPIVEALRSLSDLIDLAALPPPWLAELSRLLPELADLAPEPRAPSGAGGADARLRLFEAIARAGQLLAERAPVVLFLDDVQWADADSRDVVRYLVRRWMLARLPMLLICAVRSDELAATPALADWLTAVQRVVAVTRLTIGALSLDDTQQIVRAMSISDEERTTPDALVIFGQRVFAETDGHPLFIVQTLRALAERGLLQRDQQGGWDARLDHELPPSVRELIQQRLARLSPLAYACCIGGAVLGDGFRFADLCSLVGTGEREALSSLEELLTRGLLREQPAHEDAGEPRYFFTHDRVREVAYTQPSAARRRLLHADALAALQGRADPARLVQHALRAGMVKAAAEYSEQAGDASFRRFAIGDAINHFERAQQLWNSDSVSDADARQKALIALYRRLGRAYELHNQVERARSSYEDMLALSRIEHNLLSECFALNRLATVQAQTARDMEHALTLLQSALAIAEVCGDELVLVETFWNLAQVHFYAGRGRVAMPLAERALQMAQRVQLTELEARSLNLLAYLTGNPTGWAASERYAATARECYVQLGDRAMEADCWSLIARANVGLGRPVLAVRAGETAVMIAEEIANSWGQVSARFSLATALLEVGDSTAALTYAQQALAIGQANQLDTILPVAYLVLGTVQRVLGDLQAARQAHLVAEQILTNTESPFRHPVAVALCADYARDGAWEEAYRWAQHALETRESSNDFDADLSFWHLVEALLHADQIVLAQAEVQRFGEQVAQLPRYRIPHLRALAVLAVAEQNDTCAASYLDDALAIADAIGLPSERASILVQLAALNAA